MSVRIGISTMTRDRIGQRYVEAILAAGAEPIPLFWPEDAPDVADASAARAWLASHPDLVERMADVDGLLLTGGEDLAPSWYGEPVQGSSGLDHVRDHVEMAQIEFAREHGLPILGICRGSQVLNVAFGGALIQDLPSRERHANPPGTPSLVHPIRLHAPSWLATVLGFGEREGAEVAINSRHHQGVSIDRLGPGLVPTAISLADDGGLEIVEAFESESSRADGPLAVGVQWHPERVADEVPRLPGQGPSFAELSRRLFSAFVAAAPRRG